MASDAAKSQLRGDRETWVVPCDAANAPAVGTESIFSNGVTYLFYGIFLALIPIKDSTHRSRVFICGFNKCGKETVLVAAPAQGALPVKITPWGVSGFDAPLAPCPFLLQLSG